MNLVSKSATTYRNLPRATSARYVGTVSTPDGSGAYYTANLAHFSRRYGTGRFGQWLARRDAYAATAAAAHVPARRIVLPR